MIKRLGIAILLALPPTNVFGQATGLQLIREIGVEDGPEEYSFGQVGGIALTPRHEILILDSQAKVVRRFEFQLPRLRVVRDEIWFARSHRPAQLRGSLKMVARSALSVVPGER